nr:hypothetical protein [bacterium]
MAPATPTPTVDVFSFIISPPVSPNADAPLSISTYDGFNQATHPKVLYFPEKFSGWAYWMAYTLYPYCNDDYENPCIAVSQDGISWTVPQGLQNPLFVPDSLEGGQHYSDPHLVMTPLGMELWFRFNPYFDDGRNADGNPGYLMRSVSPDGIHWGQPERMLTTHEGWEVRLSPIVMWEGGLYRLWYAERDGVLYMRTSPDGLTWSPRTACSLAVPGHKIWHQDMIKTDLGYEIIFSAKKADATDNLHNQSLFYAISPDGITFTHPVNIISPNPRPGALDNNSIYRSSLVKVQDGYRIYYAAMSDYSVWKI